MAKPTALHVSRHGQVTAAIRAAMAKKKMTPPELRKALGLPNNSTKIYPWIAGTSIPQEDMREKVSRVLNIPIGSLLPMATKMPPYPPTKSTSLVPVIVTKAVSKPRLSTNSQLSVTLHNEDTSRLQVDALIPTHIAITIFRMISEQKSDVIP